jgi:hypothetical protein
VRLDKSAMVARTIGMVVETLEGQLSACTLPEVGRGAIREVRILAEEAREQTRAHILHALHFLAAFACGVEPRGMTSVYFGPPRGAHRRGQSRRHTTADSRLVLVSSFCMLYLLHSFRHSSRISSVHTLRFVFARGAVPRASLYRSKRWEAARRSLA